jgi:branched-chain amino acid transport system permease protein
MLTIAIAYMLRGLVSMSFGPTSRGLPTPWSGKTVALGPVVLGEINLVIVAAAVVITAVLFVFLRATRASAWRSRRRRRTSSPPISAA